MLVRPVSRDGKPIGVWRSCTAAGPDPRRPGCFSVDGTSKVNAVRAALRMHDLGDLPAEAAFRGGRPNSARTSPKRSPGCWDLL